MGLPWGMGLEATPLLEDPGFLYICRPGMGKEGRAASSLILEYSGMAAY